MAWESDVKRSLTISFLIATLGTSASLMAAPKPLVMVSIPPQEWLVKSLAGDAVEIRALLASGTDPHTFEPTARQLKNAAKASMYFTQGIPFEDRLIPKLTALNPQLAVAAMDEKIKKREEGEEPGHEHGGHRHHHDPHIWLSPDRYCQMASNTATRLSAAYPDLRQTLASGLNKTVAEIRTADTRLRQKIRPGTVWVVYHPAWDYFADDYGIKLLTIEHDGKEPSARHMAQIVKLAKEKKASLVLNQPQGNQRSAQIVAKQLKVKLVAADPLDPDWPALMRRLGDLAGNPEN